MGNTWHVMDEDTHGCTSSNRIGRYNSVACNDGQIVCEYEREVQ